MLFGRVSRQSQREKIAAAQLIYAECSLQGSRTGAAMRLRLLVASFGWSVSLVSFLFVSGCKQEPAATIKEVNALDTKSTDAPHPLEDPRFKEFFDHVR